MNESKRIIVAKIGQPYGVHGLIRVHSYTEHQVNLESYGELVDDKGQSWLLKWVSKGIAHLSNLQGSAITNRSEAEALVNRTLFIDRDQLPKLDEDEFYLTDLVGLCVYEALDDFEKGRRAIGYVMEVFDYGAGAILEIKEGETASFLLPFTKVCVPEINIESGYLCISRPHNVTYLHKENDKTKS